MTTKTTETNAKREEWGQLCSSFACQLKMIAQAFRNMGKRKPDLAEE